MSGLHTLLYDEIESSDICLVYRYSLTLDVMVACRWKG